MPIRHLEVNMIFPSIDDLTKGKYNRYELCIAVAKCARMITDEYVKERAIAEAMEQTNKESGRAAYSMIKREFRDEKAVKCAINRLYAGDFVILSGADAEAKRQARAEHERIMAENRAALEAAKAKEKIDFSDDDDDDIFESDVDDDAVDAVVDDENDTDDDELSAADIDDADDADASDND